MKAWIIYAKADAVKNEGYISFYVDEGKKRGITFEVIFVEKLQFGVKDGEWYLTYDGEMVKMPDFVVCRTIYPKLSLQLELMKIPVFNNSIIARLCNDKALTYQSVAKLKIPMIDTTFCKGNEIDSILATDTYEAPVVIKSVEGHGGSLVYLFDRASDDREREADCIRKGLNGSDFVVQPLTGKRHQDLRVYVIGTQVIAAVLRTAKQGFKSNFSLGGEVRLYELKEHELTVVNRIIECFDFGLVGIDFLIGDDGELIFNEIEDVVGARMLYQCSDINLVGRYLDYIITRINF